MLKKETIKKNRNSSLFTIKKLKKKLKKTEINNVDDFKDFIKTIKHIAKLEYRGDELADSERMELLNALYYRIQTGNKRFNELLRTESNKGSCPNYPNDNIINHFLFAELYILELKNAFGFNDSKIQDLLIEYSSLCDSLYTDGDETRVSVIPHLLPDERWENIKI